MALIGFVGSKLRDGDVGSAADRNQGLLDALGVFVLLVGDDDFEVSVPSVIGIAVGKKIHAAFAGGLDDLDVFGRFPLDSEGIELDVGVLDRDVGTFPNSN